MSEPFERRDPRSIITSEAFSLAPELLGLPLAPPGHRLAAILVDLVLIGILSRAGGLVLGVVAAVFFLRMAATRKAGDALARAFRVVVGCFGGVVLLVTGCTIFFAVGPGSDLGRLSDRFQLETSGGASESLGLAEVFGGLSEIQALRTAGDQEEARDASIALARRLGRVGVRPEDVEELIVQLSADSPWEADADAVARTALAAMDTAAIVAAGPGAGPSLAGPDRAAAAVPTESLSLDSALERYAALVRARGDASRDAAGDEERILRNRIVGEVAGDTLASLEDALSDEAADRQRAERRLEQTRQALQEAEEGGGLLAFIERMVDDLGLAFGWGGIYMTVFLSWWNGQTPGKKLVGIRVLQLDDSPMTWWEAFERSGGYAAGFATGLLGFLQVYWDPNRQAIHDKISETVVVLDGHEPVPGPWRTEGGEPGTWVGSPT